MECLYARTTHHPETYIQTDSGADEALGKGSNRSECIQRDKTAASLNVSGSDRLRGCTKV